MPSFLCESSPTGQYTSYVPTLRVRVSVAVEPGWMSSVSRSMPCPSTSKACRMLPALVTVKETGPAAIVASDGSTFHSESLAVTAAGQPGARCAAVVASATQASKTKATLRDGTASVVLMVIFLLRVCDNSFPRRWRPHAPGAYSFGNNPAVRGVLTRWRTAHPEDRFGVERARAIRSCGAAASGRRVHPGALSHAQRSRRTGRRAGRLPARVPAFRELPRCRKR